MIQLFLALFFVTPWAHASLTDQEILLAEPTPPAAESRAENVEFEFPYGSRLSIGIGSGMNSFGGNRGKLYGSSEPVLELRGEWIFHPAWSLRLSGEMANYSFNAAPNGSVKVSTTSLRASSQAHFLSTALAAEGWDPFLSLSAEHLWRSQDFQSFNTLEKDNALGLSAGVGSNYLFHGGKIALWAEASAGQIFFQDRFNSEYLESGLADTTGLLYSGRLGVKYFF